MAAVRRRVLSLARKRVHSGTLAHGAVFSPRTTANSTWSCTPALFDRITQELSDISYAPRYYFDLAPEESRAAAMQTLLTRRGPAAIIGATDETEVEDGDQRDHRDRSSAG